MDKNHVISLIKSNFPTIDWNKFEEADRALNYELWYGPLPSGYWTEVDPLEYYVWSGFDKACDDIIEILSDLPNFVYYEDGCEYLLLENPENVQDFWNEETLEYLGPEFYKINTRRTVMYVETYRQLQIDYPLDW